MLVDVPTFLASDVASDADFFAFFSPFAVDALVSAVFDVAAVLAALASDFFVASDFFFASDFAVVSADFLLEDDLFDALSADFFFGCASDVVVFVDAPPAAVVLADVFDDVPASFADLDVSLLVAAFDDEEALFAAFSGASGDSLLAFLDIPVIVADPTGVVMHFASARTSDSVRSR